MTLANPDLEGVCPKSTGLVWFFWKEFHAIIDIDLPITPAFRLISGTHVCMAPGERKDKEVDSGLCPGTEY